MSYFLIENYYLLTKPTNITLKLNLCGKRQTALVYFVEQTIHDYIKRETMQKPGSR